MPLFAFDAGGYDAAQWQRGLTDCRAQVLVRLRAGRCFYADMPKAPPGKNGRPRRHGRERLGVSRWKRTVGVFRLYTTGKETCSTRGTVGYSRLG